MSEWNEYRLGEIIEFIDGDRGKNYPNGDDFSELGHCLFLNTGNVTRNGFNFSDCMFISEAKDAKLRKGKLSRSDVILTTRGTVGNVAIYNHNIPYAHVRINSGMLIARGKGRIRQEYIHNLFRSSIMQRQFEKYSSGSAQPQLPVKDLICITVSIPDERLQDKISHLISNHDSLIENNNRRIAILEEMAQRLYREWFVHFCFPGHENVEMVESELGMIPEGWEVAQIADCCSVIRRGISPRYSDEAEGIVINQKCVRDFTVNLELARYQNKAYPPELQIQLGDVLINSTGVGTLGRIAQIYESVPNCTIDSHVTLARPYDNIQHLVGGYFREMQETIMDMGTGSTGQTELNRDKLKEMKILIPDESTVRSFESYVSSWMQLKNQLQKKNIKLRQTRDLLLPRLISGDIDVSSVDIPV